MRRGGRRAPSRPPRLARWWLQRTLPVEYRDEVIGDLDEVYARRRAQQEGAGAGLWYTSQAAACSIGFAWAGILAWFAAGAGERLSGLRLSRLDFVLGVRMLSKYPGLTLVGGLAMAVAIAAGAVGFETISQLANPVLPFDDGDRVVAIRNWDASRNREDVRVLHDYVAWRDQLRTIDDVGAYRLRERNLIVEGRGSEPVRLAEIGAAAFAIAGVEPQLGRALVEEDEAQGAPLVLVIGHDVWQSRFDGDAGVLGSTVLLGPDPATVVGVMPADFGFPVAQSAWVPLRLNAADHARGEGPALTVFGRLADGASLAQAQAELSAVGTGTAAQFPETHEHVRPQVMPYTHLFIRRVIHAPMDFGTLLQAGIYSTNLVFLLFLVLVCGNIAALVFARTATRESEIVVRTALGASRGRILSQLFAESLVLGLVAAAVGLTFAAYAFRTGAAFLDAHVFGSQMAFWFRPSLSATTLLWAGILTVGGALVAGVVPALRMTGASGTRLRQVGAGSGGVGFGGMWTAVIVGQMAVTIIFIAGTAYTLVRGTQIRSADPGFAAGEFVAARLTLDRPQDTRDQELSDAEFRTRFRTASAEVERRLLAEPGVTGVTFATVLPGSFHSRVPIQLEDGVAAAAVRAGSVEESEESNAAHDRVQTTAVDPRFFDELGVPMLSGRAFTAGDIEAQAEVVIVNPEFVEHLLQGRNAIGQRVRFMVAEDPDDPWGPWHEIVGVVSQIALTNDPELPHAAGIYKPLAPAALGDNDWALGASSIHVVAHTSRRDPMELAPRLRALSAQVDPSLRVYDIIPLSEVVTHDLALYWFWLRVLVLVSALGLLLALAAIYSVMSYTVSRRTREIGIRVALGADHRRIVTATLAGPLTQAALGVFVGVGLLVLLGGGIRTMQFAGVVLAFTAVMFAVVMLACIVPIRRALGIEPTEALKAE